MTVRRRGAGATDRPLTLAEYEGDAGVDAAGMPRPTCQAEGTLKVQAAEVAEEYFRCIRDKDAAGIARFFAPDAARITYKGAEAHGHDEVVEWYVTHDFSVNYVWNLPDGTVFRPTPELSAPIGTLRPLLPGIVDGNRAAVEVQVELDTGERYHVLDLFTLNNDGQVRLVQVYQGGFVAT